MSPDDPPRGTANAVARNNHGKLWVGSSFCSGRRVVPTPYLFSVMSGMARRAVPARVVQGGTNIGVTLEFQGVAPLHAVGHRSAMSHMH